MPHFDLFFGTKYICVLFTILGHITSGNTGKFLHCDPAALTNRVHYTSQHDAVMNTVSSYDD